MSLLHPDIAAIDAKNATPEEVEKLLSDPLLRSLQYQIANGVRDIKLETNQGETKINNICVPEGVNEQEYLQKIMAENQRNEAAAKKAEERRKEAARQEKLKKSDPWQVIVSGAGSERVNGTYERDGEAVRNGGRVYNGPNGYSFSFECVSGGEGWILGKAPRAFYAIQTKDKIPPETDWSVQEHGKAPAPTFTHIEPLQAVNQLKERGNEAFKVGSHEEAIAQYTEALSLCTKCSGAHGIDDDVYGKLHGNRAEAYLQLGQFDKAIEEAEQAIEYDPCFVKAYVRKAKACFALERQDEAKATLKDALDVAPGSKEVLSLQDEYRVASLAKSGKDTVLAELDGLTSRLSSLLKRKGTASEVVAIFKQLPTLLTALKLVEDVGNIGDRGYESAPNYDAQVYFRMQTQNFALLAPLVRPLPKQQELLKECLETLASALRDCPSNQVHFDKFVPQLVPLLRAKSTLPYESLKASVKVLGAMAHRAAARKIMYDPESAEGVMHVLSHPDSSQARPATLIIKAIDELKDMNTLATLLSVPDACDTFWRESHSRREDIRNPARSILARAFGHGLCRKRLRIVERTKRLAGLFEQLVEKEKELENWDVGDPDAFEADTLTLRDLTLMPPESHRVLTALVDGTAREALADAEIAERLHSLGVWQHLASAIFARPPLSTAALKLLRAMMGHSQKVIDRIVALGIPAWMLQCREQSDASEDLNANMRTTLMSQDARDEACQILGLVANQGPFHAAVDAFDGGFVLRRMCEVLGGNPSDDAACGGCKCLEWLVKYQSYRRLPTLRPQDVHDVVIPVWLHKEDAAKDAAGKALTHILSNKAWMAEAWTYFEERESVAKLNQVIQEMNQFEALKQMRTTGKRTDQLRPNGVPLETTLETEARRETLNPPKVVELLRRDMDDGATIVDVGAGTGLFTFAFSEALPAASIFALEVRTDALQTLNERKRNEGAKSANVTVMRMDEGVVPLLPQGQTADLVFICDVLDFVPAEKKDSFLSSLRSLLSEDGRLVVIESRDHWETHLVDIQDAGFLQKRIAQIVAARRIMAFEADPAATASPPLKAAPSAKPEDTEPPPKPKPPNPPTKEAEPPQAERQLTPEERFNMQVNDTGYDLSGYSKRTQDSFRAAQTDPRVLATLAADGESENRIEEVEDDEDDEDCCVLEENPTPKAGKAATQRATSEVDDDDDDDDDVCVLEENPGGGEGNSDDEDGCILEENPSELASGQRGSRPAEIESDDEEGCVLEDN